MRKFTNNLFACVYIIRRGWTSLFPPGYFDYMVIIYNKRNNFQTGMITSY